MFKDIIEYISNNKEWLFSGVIPTLLAFIAGFICNNIIIKSRQKKKEKSSKKELSLESCMLLIYASYDNDITTKAIAPSYRLVVSTRKRSFMKDLSPKESAIWQDALEELLDNGLIRQENIINGCEMYGLTGEGHRKAQELKLSMNINISENPLEELKKIRKQ